MEDFHVPCLQQKLETLSADERWATLLLFREVKNVPDLRKAVKGGELQCTLLDAAIVRKRHEGGREISLTLVQSYG